MNGMPVAFHVTTHCLVHSEDLSLINRSIHSLLIIFDLIIGYLLGFSLELIFGHMI